MLGLASGLKQDAVKPVVYCGLNGDRWTVDSWAWWHMPMIPAVWYGVRVLGQENHKFKFTLDCIMSSRPV